jgi:hypothetical protein
MKRLSIGSLDYAWSLEVNSMEIQPAITRKDIDFINDIDLRAMLLERLNELERVFLANGHYSTIFLAISSIEGMLAHIASIFKANIKLSSNYPKNQSGKPIDFEKLTIDQLCF